MMSASAFDSECAAGVFPNNGTQELASPRIDYDYEPAYAEATARRSTITIMNMSMSMNGLLRLLPHTACVVD
jgi:hypothetical protein